MISNLLSPSKAQTATRGQLDLCAAALDEPVKAEVGDAVITRMVGSHGILLTEYPTERVDGRLPVLLPVARQQFSPAALQSHLQVNCARRQLGRVKWKSRGDLVLPRRGLVVEPGGDSGMVPSGDQARVGRHRHTESQGAPQTANLVTKRRHKVPRPEPMDDREQEVAEISAAGQEVLGVGESYAELHGQRPGLCFETGRTTGSREAR